MEVLLFSNQKVPCYAFEGTKPTSYKNAQHQNQLNCLSTEAPVLFVFIKRFLGGVVFYKKVRANVALQLTAATLNFQRSENFMLAS